MSQIPRHHNVVALVGICRGDKVCILSGKWSVSEWGSEWMRA
jgi:hypothetical protein